MEDSVAHLGLGFLHIVAVLGMMAIIGSFLQSGGVIHTAVASFMVSICG